MRPALFLKGLHRDRSLPVFLRLIPRDVVIVGLFRTPCLFVVQLLLLVGDVLIDLFLGPGNGGTDGLFSLSTFVGDVLPPR